MTTPRDRTEELPMVPCESCETPYDPIGTRWKCPHCGFKNHCCG